MQAYMRVCRYVWMRLCVRMFSPSSINILFLYSFFCCCCNIVFTVKFFSSTLNKQERTNSSAAALVHDHVGNVPLHDVVLVVEVEHGHGAELGGNAAGVHGARAHPPHAVLVHHRCVEGRGRPRDARHVGRTVPLAVVPKVA